ncbi:hypothetical protein [Mycoplasma hafezii]|uniref:hypothetical protein n=1 Tax=Mycoplasma hafezii TaxID=525886 RepID=UPI003CF01B2F
MNNDKDKLETLNTQNENNTQSKEVLFITEPAEHDPKTNKRKKFLTRALPILGGVAVIGCSVGVAVYKTDRRLSARYDDLIKREHETFVALNDRYGKVLKNSKFYPEAKKLDDQATKYINNEESISGYGARRFESKYNKYIEALSVDSHLVMVESQLNTKWNNRGVAMQREDLQNLIDKYRKVLQEQFDGSGTIETLSLSFDFAREAAPIEEQLNAYYEQVSKIADQIATLKVTANDLVKKLTNAGKEADAKKFKAYLDKVSTSSNMDLVAAQAELQFLEKQIDTYNNILKEK